MLVAEAGVAVAEDDAHVVAVGDIAQRARRRRVADQRQPRVGAEQRRGEVAARRRQEHRSQRLCLAFAGDEDEQLAGGEQRTKPDGQRVGGDVLEAAELRGCVGARPRMQRDDARALLQARSWLVERDVPVVAESEHREVDLRLVETSLVALALGGGIGRRAVESVERAEVDAAQLALEVGAEAALVVRAEPAVLVELEHRRFAAPQCRVRAQRGVDAERRPAGRQKHAQTRARAQPVRDQLRRGSRDLVRPREDERRGRHSISRSRSLAPPRMPAMSSVESTPTGAVGARLHDDGVARVLVEHALGDLVEAVVRMDEQHAARAMSSATRSSIIGCAAQDVAVGEDAPRPAADGALGVDRLAQHDDRVHMLARHPLRDGDHAWSAGRR